MKVALEKTCGAVAIAALCCTAVMFIESVVGVAMSLMGYIRIDTFNVDALASVLMISTLALLYLVLSRKISELADRIEAIENTIEEGEKEE